MTLKFSGKKFLAAFIGAVISASIVSILYYLLNDDHWIKMGIINFGIMLAIFYTTFSYKSKWFNSSKK